MNTLELGWISLAHGIQNVVPLALELMYLDLDPEFARLTEQEFDNLL